MSKRTLKEDGLQTESCKKSRLIDEGPKFRVNKWLQMFDLKINQLFFFYKFTGIIKRRTRY